MDVIDWPGLVFNSENMAAIDKLSSRRFGEGSLAEEASTYAIEYLSKDDWSRCRAYKGQANPRTYLFTIVNNALEEFSRARFGRVRPPTWLKDMGELWIKLWKALCLERQALPAIIDRFCSNGFRNPEDVSRAAQVIKARIPSCGQSIRDAEQTEDIDAISDQAQHEKQDTSSGNTCEPDIQFQNPLLGELIIMLQAICLDKPMDTEQFQTAQHVDQIAAKHETKFDSFKQAISLNDQEAIILRMAFTEGMSKTAISKALGLAPHQAGRIANDALQRVSEALTKFQIELDDLLGMV